MRDGRSAWWTAASAPGDDRTHGMMAAVTPEQRLRQVVNLINLSTPLGLLIARVAGSAAVAAGFRPCAVCMPERYAHWKAKR